MNFLRRLAEMRATNTAATKATEKVLQQADKDHEVALEMRDRVTTQAGRLKDHDRRNHYSEGLTYSMRGKPAS